MEKKDEKTVEKSAVQAAEEELDALEKSLGGKQEKEETDLDALEKAIAESEESLKKSDDNDGDDEGEEEDEEGMEKSEDSEDLDELVKASEAFAALEKSVHDIQERLEGQIDRLEKSVASLLSLSTRQAKVIALLTKSVQEGSKEKGAAPLKKSAAVLDTGEEDKGELKKSAAEIREILTKSVQDGKEAASVLSLFAVKGIDGVLPFLKDETKAAIGI